MNENLYISYSWQGESESIVQLLLPQLENQGISYKLDKKNIDLNGSITEFMQDIGEADHILVIIDKKYLESEYCLYELFQIFIKSRTTKEVFLSKIHLLVLKDADLYNKVTLQQYELNWKKYVTKLNEYLFPEFHRISAFLPEMLKIISDAKVEPINTTQESISKLCDTLKNRISSRTEIKDSIIFEIFKETNLDFFKSKLYDASKTHPKSEMIELALTTIPIKTDINKFTQQEIDQKLISLNQITSKKNNKTYKTAFALIIIYIIEYYQKWNFIIPTKVDTKYDITVKNSQLLKPLFIGAKLSAKSKNVLRELHQNY